MIQNESTYGFQHSAKSKLKSTERNKPSILVWSKAACGMLMTSLSIL